MRQFNDKWRSLNPFLKISPRRGFAGRLHMYPYFSDRRKRMPYLHLLPDLRGLSRCGFAIHCCSKHTSGVLVHEEDKTER